MEKKEKLLHEQLSCHVDVVGQLKQFHKRAMIKVLRKTTVLSDPIINKAPFFTVQYISKIKANVAKN